MNVPKPLVRLAYQPNRAYWWVFRPITLGVRAMIIQDDKIVLVKPKYKNRWNFPGGGAKKGETPEQAVRREVYEETKIKMNELDLQGIYTNKTEKKTDHIVLFHCNDYTREKGEPSWEIEKMEVFKLDGLPENLNKGAQRRMENYLKTGKAEADYW